MPEAPPNSIHPKSRAEWRAWLEQNHDRPEGVWLISFRKATDQPRVEYGEAVEEALYFCCFFVIFPSLFSILFFLYVY